VLPFGLDLGHRPTPLLATFLAIGPVTNRESVVQDLSCAAMELNYAAQGY
jgi:hypothetical protein